MKITLLLLFVGLMLTGCNSELDLFNEKADGYAKSENTINDIELEDLANDIKLNASDRDFKRFYTDGKPDASKLIVYLEKRGYTLPVTPQEKRTKNYVNVYIENSGSMNGYINGNTEFKAAIQDLLVLLKYEYDEENIKLYFINSGIYPTNIDNDLAGFAGALNAKSFRVGETASSNLNNVFKQVLDKTSKDTLSILVSDCIYSIKGGKTEDLLSDQKSLTKDAFLTKSKEKLNLTTSITKLSSQFNGNYWDKNDKATMLSNKQRPYYIIAMGGKRAMNHFNAKIPFSKDKVAGYEDTYTMSFSDNSKLNYYSVIATTHDAGSYKANREYAQDNAITGIEDVAGDSRNDNDFAFSVAVDMAKIPVTEAYITNKANYTITMATILLVVFMLTIKPR